MKKIALISIVAAIACAVVLYAGFQYIGWWYFPSTSLHYKLSVDVADNGVLRHGEGVYEVVFKSSGFMLIGNTPEWRIGVRGEAFGIDMGDRGTMFVLMSEDRTRSSYTPLEQTSAEAGRAALWAYYGEAFGNATPDRNGLRTIEAFIRSHRTVVDVNLPNLPFLVRFRDINDPRTVERVDPYDLAATFGAGVKLAHATVQIVDEPVTTGIEKKLPWFHTHAGPLGGQVVEDQSHPERDVTLGAFIEGR